MSTVLLVVHVLLALALIVTVLLQRSEGGALGIGGGGGGGMSGFLTGRATANVLTRATAILAVLFMATSVALAVLAGQANPRRSIIDTPPATSAPAPGAIPADPALPNAAPAGQPTGSEPAQPAAPSR
jgi:preprotein translocase subunit SecG